jgi:flagellar hook-associated protein 3 FlgL
MRVTQLEIYQNFLGNIETLNERLDQANRQVSSGKLLQSLKDSPASSAQIISLSEQASDIDQYQSNVDSGSYYLGMADSILNEINNLTTTIYAKGNQSASGSINSDARATIASEIRSLRDQMIALANSQALGRYLFAGSKTSSAPYTIGGDVVQYNGSQEANQINIDDGLTIKTSVAGSAAFNPIFTAVESLLSNMDGNNLSGISTALGQFSSAISELGAARGEIGANLSTLNNTKTNLESRETSLKERRSQVEDVNMAEAAVQLTQFQNALQASLSAGGSIMQQRNLFDILG